MAQARPIPSALSAERPPDPRRWLILTIVLAAPLLAIFDQFVVNVAIATMQRDLRASFGQIQLVIAGYALAFAVLLITGGRLGDLWGRKRCFMLGLGGFTLASALCGLAPSPEFLIAARVAQGCAAALMTPQALALIRVTFPGREQSAAFAIYGAVLGLAGILGQVVGGLLIRANLFGLSWRPIFLINLPVGLVAVVAAAFLLRESRPPVARRLDLGGVTLVSLGLFLLVGPLVIGRDAGWPAWSLVCLLAAPPTLAIFIVFERRLAARDGAPLLDLGLFRSRTFVIGLLIASLQNLGNAGYFLTLALYLQLGLRFSPLQAGITFVPDAIGFFIAATLSARLVPKIGSRILLLGVTCRAIGLLILIAVAHRLGADAQSAHLMPGLFIQGFGSGCLAAPLIAFILRGIRSADAGAAAGVLSTVQQVSGALGVALIGLLFFSLLARQADGVGRALVLPLRQELAAVSALAPDTLDATLADFRACVQARAEERDIATAPPACARPTLATTDPARAAPLARALTIANARLYADAFVGAVGCVIATLVLAGILSCFLPTTQAAPNDDTP